MPKLPEGWEACSIEDANDAWTPWCSLVDICRDTLLAWVRTPGDNRIYSEDWDVLGIIPIRKVKQEPFETTVTPIKTYDSGWDYLHITVQVPREGKYRVVEVVE